MRIAQGTEQSPLLQAPATQTQTGHHAPLAPFRFSKGSQSPHLHLPRNPSGGGDQVEIRRVEHGGLEPDRAGRGHLDDGADGRAAEQVGHGEITRSAGRKADLAVNSGALRDRGDGSGAGDGSSDQRVARARACRPGLVIEAARRIIKEVIGGRLPAPRAGPERRRVRSGCLARRGCRSPRRA